MSRLATSECVVRILAGARRVATGNTDQPTAIQKSGAKLSAGAIPEDQVAPGTVSLEITKALFT